VGGYLWTKTKKGIRKKTAKSVGRREELNYSKGKSQNKHSNTVKVHRGEKKKQHQKRVQQKPAFQGGRHFGVWVEFLGEKEKEK